MIFALLAIGIQGKDTAQVAADFLHRYFDRDMTRAQVQAKVVNDESPMFGADSFRTDEAWMTIDRETGEVVSLGARLDSKSRLPKIDVHAAGDDQYQAVVRELRPNWKGTFTFRVNGQNGGPHVDVIRSFDGIPVQCTYPTSFMSFRGETGEFVSMNLPPTEKGIEPLSEWISKVDAVKGAMSNFAEVLPTSEQIDVGQVKKVYVNTYRFMGRKNPKHRAFTDPKLNRVLLPAYMVTLEDGDTRLDDIKAARLYAQCYIDARDGSLIGFTRWTGGGVTHGIAEPQPIDDCEYSMIRFGTLLEPKLLKFRLRAVQTSTQKTGRPSILFGEKHLAKVKIDAINKLVWRGNHAYTSDEPIWAP